MKVRVDMYRTYRTTTSSYPDPMFRSRPTIYCPRLSSVLNYIGNLFTYT